MKSECVLKADSLAVVVSVLIVLLLVKRFLWEVSADPYVIGRHLTKKLTHDHLRARSQLARHAPIATTSMTPAYSGTSDRYT